MYWRKHYRSRLIFQSIQFRWNFKDSKKISEVDRKNGRVLEIWRETIYRIVLLYFWGWKNWLWRGHEKKLFRSTRIVEAENQKRAETIAREFIRNDPRLQNSVLNEESDPPGIHLESVIEVPVWHMMLRIVLTRFTGKAKINSKRRHNIQANLERTRLFNIIRFHNFWVFQ